MYDSLNIRKVSLLETGRPDLCGIWTGCGGRVLVFRGCCSTMGNLGDVQALEVGVNKNKPFVATKLFGVSATLFR